MPDGNRVWRLYHRGEQSWELVVYIFGGLDPVWQADLGPSARTPECTMHFQCIGRRVRWPAVARYALQGTLRNFPEPVRVEVDSTQRPKGQNRLKGLNSPQSP